MDNNFSIAAAQIKPINHNISDSIDYHLQMLDFACLYDINLIVFPELSITGYTLAPSEDEIFDLNDLRLKIISDFCIKKKIHAVVGVPLKIEESVYIASVLYDPDGNFSFYCKQNLHAPELDVYSNGVFNNHFIVERNHISLAICADINNPFHAQKAKEMGGSIYIVSSLISNNGFNADSDLLSQTSLNNAIPIVMTNFIGETGGWLAAGGSSVWDSHGQLIVQGSFKEPCLVIASFGEHPKGKVILA